MAERFATRISIGGRLHRHQLARLLDAVYTANIACGWSHAHLKPKSSNALIAALKERKLWLCDDEASWGEFPELEKTCRDLGPAYTRRSDGGVAGDAEAVEWRPGMRTPLMRVGSKHNHATFVPTSDVARALRNLEAGRTDRAKALLRMFSPRISRLSAFTIV